MIMCFSVVASSAGATMDPDTLKPKVIVLKSKGSLREIARLPKIIKEASGLEFTGKHFWTHNDDGIPALYCLDSAGTLQRAVQLNSLNRGWEDLTTDDEGNLYIGGFGNNRNDKQDLKIYRIQNPETISEPVTTPEIIQYTYSDQKYFPPDKSNRNFDVDAFFHFQGSLYLFTKNRSSPFVGFSKIYKLPATPGTQVAELIDSVYVGSGAMINNWITSADTSPDGKTVALLFHDRLWFIRGFSGTKVSSGGIYELSLEHYTHKAGLCFKDDKTLYIVDELEAGLIGGKFYAIDIGTLLKEIVP